MQSLEETIKKLESGDLPLSESIEQYKTSMQLVQYCRKQLNQAELEIEQLMDARTEPEQASESAPDEQKAGSAEEGA
ncbi:exodeoxyribonuclease VII small subunit [Alicyclobacillus sp. SO9]|nr:exodeoxyribonuclease VII small subunit [Alicyclobacillus sp. SO9]